MALRIPRTPQTQAVGRQEGYARATQPLDYSPIARPVSQLQQELEEEHARIEQFDLQRRLVDETNQLMTDFDQRKQVAPLGAAGFTEQVNTDYQKRHEEILNEYWEKGYSEEALRDFSLRLGALRQGIAGQALNFQTDSVRSLASKQMGDFTVSLSQYATRNPDGFASAEEQLREGVWAIPGLTEQDRHRVFDENLSVIRQGAAKGLALQNPQLVIDALDPEGFTAPQQAAPGGAYETLEGWQKEVGAVLGARMPPAVVAGFLGNFEVEGGHSGAKGDGGTASGLAQWRDDRRDNFRAMFGKDPSEASITEQAEFVAWEMDNPTHPSVGMTVEQRDAILAADDPEEAAELIDKYYERSSGEHRDRRRDAARAHYSTIQTIDPGASTAEQAPRVELPESRSNEFDPTSIATGHPVLDSLNGPERLQLLGWAREQQAKTNAQVRGSMDVAVENAVNAWINEGEYAGPALTREQVVEVYGPIEGEQKWAQVEGAQQTGQVIQRIRTMSPTSIITELERLKPDPASPTYSRDLQMYEAAQRAATKVLSDRQADPAAYVFQAFPEIGQAMAGAETSEQRRQVYAQIGRAMNQLGIPEREQVFFTDDMLENVGAQYRAAPATEKFGILQSYITEMGGEAAGRTLGRAVGKEVADDLRLFSLLSRTSNFRQTFMEVMNGKKIISDDPARKPNFETVNREFANTFGKALNYLSPQYSSAVNEAAAALYVQRGGRTETGGVLTDSDLYEQSVREVLGGNANERTGFANMQRDEITILPPGVNQTQFENWVEQLEPGDLTRLTPDRRAPVDRTGRRIPLEDIIDEGAFIMLAPGRYGIKMEDGKWIANTAGEQFVIHLDFAR